MTTKDATAGGDGSITGDRDLDCSTYLEAGIEGLVVKALAAGWNEDEISNALLGLVQDRISVPSRARPGTEISPASRPGKIQKIISSA